MKVSELLKEESSINNIADKIRKYCQPYLTQKPQKLNLFRGMNSQDIFLRKKVHLADREPRAMPVELHQSVNKYFVKEFGEPFRNSMLCTGNALLAQSYVARAGSSYAVFPTGKFSFCWSPEVEDLNYEINPYMNHPDDDEVNIMALSDKERDRYVINQLMPPLKYTTTNIEQAIRSNNEVMIRSNSYFAVRLDWLDEVMDLL